MITGFTTQARAFTSSEQFLCYWLWSVPKGKRTCRNNSCVEVNMWL